MGGGRNSILNAPLDDGGALFARVGRGSSGPRTIEGARGRGERAFTRQLEGTFGLGGSLGRRPGNGAGLQIIVHNSNGRGLRSDSFPFARAAGRGALLAHRQRWGKNHAILGHATTVLLEGKTDGGVAADAGGLKDAQATSEANRGTHGMTRRGTLH